MHTFPSDVVTYQLVPVLNLVVHFTFIVSSIQSTGGITAGREVIQDDLHQQDSAVLCRQERGGWHSGPGTLNLLPRD